MLTIAFPYRPATVGSPPLKGRGPGWDCVVLYLPLSPSISFYLPLSPSISFPLVTDPAPIPAPAWVGNQRTHTFSRLISDLFRPLLKCLETKGFATFRV